MITNLFKEIFDTIVDTSILVWPSKLIAKKNMNEINKVLKHNRIACFVVEINSQLTCLV